MSSGNVRSSLIRPLVLLGVVLVASCVGLAILVVTKRWDSDRWIAVGSIAAGIQALGVIAALVYAGGQLAESRESRRERDRPFVVVDFDTTSLEHFIHLDVTNLGHTLAHNVTFEFRPPLQSAQELGGKLDPQFWPSTLLSRGFKTLAPGVRVRTVFDFSPDRKEVRAQGIDVPDAYEVIVRYEGPDGSRWTTEYALDVGYAAHVTHIARKNMHDAVEELTKVRKLLEKAIDRDGLHVAPRGE